MNQKFEKFKSKEISNAESEKVIGGNTLDCIFDCELELQATCTIYGFEGSEAYERCLFQGTQKCFADCLAAELDL